MKSRIKHLKKLFQEKTSDDGFLIPRYYEDFCEGDEMPAGLFQKKTTRSRFYFTKYPNLQSPSKCARDLEGTPKTRFSSRSFQVQYNSVQQALYDRLFGSVSSFDNTWFQHNDDFIQKLPIRDKLALVAMTNKSQQHIQAYLKGEDTSPFKRRVRNWRPTIHGYLPIFFPLHQKYKNTFKKSSMAGAYKHIIEKVCPQLTDDEIDQCIVELVKQIRHIFSICPKTTQKMTLWRGLRSPPHPRPYPGFTSLSLNPFHTLNYTGKECCLQKLTILPGTPLLFIGGLSSFKNELECVLPDNTNVYEIKKSVEMIPIAPKMKGKCPTTQDTKRIIVQHTVVL